MRLKGEDMLHFSFSLFPVVRMQMAGAPAAFLDYEDNGHTLGMVKKARGSLVS